MSISFVKEGLSVVPSNKNSNIIESIFWGWSHGLIRYNSHFMVSLYLDEDEQIRMDADYVKNLNPDDWNISYDAHFVQFQNLFDVLCKHTTNGHMKLLGMATLSTQYEDHDLCSLYFKLKNNKYLEVIIFSEVYGLFWVNEVDSIDELHLNDVDYIFIDKDVIVQSWVDAKKTFTLIEFCQKKDKILSLNVHGIKYCNIEEPVYSAFNFMKQSKKATFI